MLPAMRKRIKWMLICLWGLAVCPGCEFQPTNEPNSSSNVKTGDATDGFGGNSPESSRTSPLTDQEPAVFEVGEFDWAQYRGPETRSVQNSPNLPDEWSDDAGIFWRAELPGRGSSSPIVVGDRVFVTAYSGYGISPTDRGQVGNLRYHVICKDRQTGKTIWQRNIKGSPLTQRLNDTLLGHGFASSTPATDGERVYVFLGATGVFAFDMNGELAWQQNVGVQFYFFGSSASLTTFQDLVIVNASVENKTIYAFDRKTGKGVWKIDDIDRCYSMPVFGKAPDGSIEMIVSEEDLVHGYDPATGKELWRCDGVHNYIIAVPAVRNGICYCNGGLERQMMAIKLGGREDVTQTHKLWEVPFGGNVGSPLLHDEVIYVPNDNGILESYDAETGKRLKRVRTGTKTRIYGNLLLVNDKIYIPLQDEGVLIVEANEKMKEIRRNRIATDPASVHASIAPNGDRLFMRTDGFLYCISDGDGSSAVIQYDSADNGRDLLEPEPRVDFVAETNRLQQYCYYLAPNVKAVSNLLLVPYKSVITEEQTRKSEEIIRKNFSRFDELRGLQNEAWWEFMMGEIDREGLSTKLEEVDKETIKYSSQVRVLIKKLFSKEQMDQHLKDAAEWRRRQEEKKKQAQQKK